MPVTAKFRKGLPTTLLTYLDAGRSLRGGGSSAIALHARTAEQHYAGTADWNAIGELKAAGARDPRARQRRHLGGRRRVRDDAHTGCDGVVVGRGCLGRPWLFRDLVERSTARHSPRSPASGGVRGDGRPRRLLADHLGEELAMRDFRKHTSWYLTGYPVGGEVRRRFANVSTLGELDTCSPGSTPP